MKDPIIWYQRGNEVLQPLRYHIHELIGILETDNRLRVALKQPPIYLRQLKEAKKASAKAERFFVPKRP